MVEQLKIDNDIINHLLFHKALVDENDDASQINKYLHMVNSGEIENVSKLGNPFEQSIALMFNLVITQGYDPWNIDLVNFSTMYLKRAKDEKIDLITAGRIIYMAWKILRLQSDNLVMSMESNVEDETFGFDWADLPSGGWFDSDDGYSYANLVMNMPKPPLEEPIRRKSQRKVTLMELLDAFDDARKESEEYQLLDKMRREERIRLSDLARKHMKGTVHDDHIEDDVSFIWDKICKINSKNIQLHELCDIDDSDDRIKTLISILFLAYDNKIKVSQRSFPFGKIYIKNIEYT